MLNKGPWALVLEVPLAPDCIVSVAVNGPLTYAGLEKLEKYIDLLKISYEHTRLPVLQPGAGAEPCSECGWYLGRKGGLWCADCFGKWAGQLQPPTAAPGEGE